MEPRKEELTCGSYLDNHVDILMMMIYAVSINLRRFDEVSMSNDLPKEATAPSLLHNKHQPYQICCIMRKKSYRKVASEIIDRIDTSENPLIQNASKSSELRNPCKNAHVEVALL